MDSRSPPLVTGDYRLGDIRHGYGDLASIGAWLQFRPEVSLDQGLTRFVEWVKTQPLEPDRLDKATGELVARGLMSGPSPADLQSGDLPSDVSTVVMEHVNAKAASV